MEPEPTYLESLFDAVPVEKAHPNLRKFKINFQQNKFELCKLLFNLFNKEVFGNKLPQSLQDIQWSSRAKSRAGCCKYIQIPGTPTKCTIVLSEKVINSPQRLCDTLIHEMCHAAVWHIYGVNDGYGKRWRKWTRRVRVIFPELPRITRCHSYEVDYQYTYECTNEECGQRIERHMKVPSLLNKKRCGYCRSRFRLL